MGGGSSPPSKTTTTTEPWKEQKPYLLDVFKQAQARYNEPGPSYYPGVGVAPFDPATTAAQNYITGPGFHVGAALAGQGVNSALYNLTSGRDPGSNPYLARAVQGMQTSVLRPFVDAGGTLSGIRDQFTGAGQFGSTRQGIAEGLAFSRLGETLADQAAGMYSNAYDTGLRNATQTLALLPQVQQGINAPALAVDAVGQQRQLQEQQYINDLMNRWNYQQNIPDQELQNYQALITGNYGGTSQMKAPASGGGNPLTGALGGAATGAALGGYVPGIGPGVGAGIGAIAGLFGML